MSKVVMGSIPFRLPEMPVAIHFTKPSFARPVARLIRPPIHTSVSHAPFSVMISFHSNAPRTSMKPMQTRAIMVAFRPVKEVVAHMASAARNAINTVVSALLMGPIFCSSSLASCGASGVWVSSGVANL